MFKVYKIHKLSLAMHLKSMENNLLTQYIDPKNNKYYIFVFEDNAKFREDLTAITTSK